MKKLFTLICAIGAGIPFLPAQDIIHTTNGDSIIAKVEIIREQDITYHRQDNLTGPTYVLSTEQVSYITYENGTTEHFTTHKEEKITENSNQDNRLQTPFVTRSGNTYYYQNGAMDKKAYLRFLEKNCSQAYWEANKGLDLANIGWGLFGVGISLDLGVTIGMLAQGGTSPIVSVFSWIGGCCEIASIPPIGSWLCEDAQERGYLQYAVYNGPEPALLEHTDQPERDRSGIELLVYPIKKGFPTDRERDKQQD